MSRENTPTLATVHIELNKDAKDKEKRIKELLAKAIAHYIDTEQGLV